LLSRLPLIVLYTLFATRVAGRASLVVAKDVEDPWLACVPWAVSHEAPAATRVEHPRRAEVEHDEEETCGFDAPRL
jgi:hypothetical protein